MTELQHSISRLKAWIRDYGSEKGPVFISDLEAVIAALTPPAVEETPNDWKVPGKPDLCHHGISKWGMCGKCRAERESSPPEACPSDIAAIQAAPQCPECAETVEQAGGKDYPDLPGWYLCDGPTGTVAFHFTPNSGKVLPMFKNFIGPLVPQSAITAATAELTAKVERLERTTFALASDLGRSEGKLLAGEMVGVVDGWKSRAEAAESQLTALQSQLAACEKALDTDDAEFPQPHPQFLTKCAAARMTMKAMGGKLAEIDKVLSRDFKFHWQQDEALREILNPQ